MHILRIPLIIAAILLSNSISAYAAAPTAPSFSFLNYSDTAAELFWERSTSDTGGMIYTVTKNGETIYTGDALSLFDNSLETGLEYNYTLIVSDPSGSTSSPVSVSFTSDGLAPVRQQPNAPTGVRADVYSSSALELFWTRVNTETLVYEVIQDGVSLGTTDGTSFYISSGVQRGPIYNFEIIAQRNDSSGIQTSTPAAINLSLNSTDTSPIPSEPSNARIERYSSTTAELFWDRATATEQIELTEIYRNSELIGTTSGTSFIDNSRSNGIDYLYTLVSVNTSGMRSIEANVLEEPSPTPTFSINSDNLNEVLNTVAAVVNATPFNSFVQTANNLASANEDGLTLVSQEQGSSSRVQIST